jgi:hypothetical protein
MVSFKNEYLKVVPCYNVLDKCFDDEKSAREYLNSLVDKTISDIIGDKPLEQWIEEVVEHIVSNENTIREESKNYRVYHLDNIHYETSIYYDENDLTIDNLACISFKKDFGIKITEKQLIK